MDMNVKKLMIGKLLKWSTGTEASPSICSWADAPISICCLQGWAAFAIQALLPSAVLARCFGSWGEGQNGP